MQTKIQQCNALKRKCDRPGLVVGRDDLTLIVFLAFSWTVGMKMQSKLVNSKSHRATLNQIPLDRGKGVRSFDEMDNYDLGGVDVDDPTTNVRGRCALAIATPTPGGY